MYKRIFCFGDSNTWGYIPKTGMRYPYEKRWTGILQKMLGDKTIVLEEGLNSRTTNIDDPMHEGKNGKTVLIPLLLHHNPIDIVILFLGTNDMKQRFHRTPDRIAQGIKSLLLDIQLHARTFSDEQSQVLLICPPIIDESVSGVAEKYLGAEEKSTQLPQMYEKLSQKYKTLYLNLQEFVKPSKKDGYHLEEDAHMNVAKRILRIIRCLPK